MLTAKEAREARRKRILARGSDRLAYITGDTSKQQSLKDPLISPPHGSSSFNDQTIAEELGNGFDESQIVEDVQKHIPDSEPDQASAEPSRTIPVPVSSSSVVEGPKVTVSLIAATSGHLTQARKAVKKCHTSYVKNIVQSIEASEGLRALAAAVVAVFVVAESILSCCDHPWGDTLAVFLPRWPLSLVCITDLTLVIGAYVIHSQYQSSRKALSGSSPSEGLDGSFDKISKALDVVGQFEDLLNLGLLCKKAAGAISLDCSIYAVILVCGFSICDYMFSCCRGY